MADDNYFYINLKDLKEEPTKEEIAKERQEAFEKTSIKSLKQQHKIKRDEFYHNLEAYYHNNGGKNLPGFADDYFEWIRDYIEILEKRNEELEAGIKTNTKKKVMYRVEVLYEHDMDIEHRQVYFGTDVKRARKEYMDYFDFFDITGDELYYFPLEDARTCPDEARKYTGLEIKQKFLDYFNEHVNKNQSININFDGAECETVSKYDISGPVGCKVDILEV